MQWPHGDRPHGGLLADPGDHPVDGDRLLQQRRLHVHVRGLDTRGRRRREQVTLFEGLHLLRIPRKYVSVAGNGSGVVRPLSKRCLEENITGVGGFVGEGGAAERHLAFLHSCFKGGQLEDITGDGAGRRPALGLLFDGGSGWCCTVMHALLLRRQHDAGGVTLLHPQPVVLLSELHRSRRSSPGTLQHIHVGLPLQVCMSKRREKGQTYMHIA